MSKRSFFRALVLHEESGNRIDLKSTYPTMGEDLHAIAAITFSFMEQLAEVEKIINPKEKGMLAAEVIMRLQQSILTLLYDHKFSGLETPEERLAFAQGFADICTSHQQVADAFADFSTKNVQ